MTALSRDRRELQRSSRAERCKRASERHGYTVPTLIQLASMKDKAYVPCYQVSEEDGPTRYAPESCGITLCNLDLTSCTFISFPLWHNY